jgi:hypothetical protein
LITTLAKLLQELKAKEAAKLAVENITHPPTIGAMYEGLTRDILDRVIPSSLDLRIVDGFLEDDEGNLSPQIDLMLVSGSGREIPHTTGFVWPVQNVLAVLEVKKNLYGADLKDAFHKLRAVNDMYGAYTCRAPNKDQKFNITPAYNAFARLTGHYPRDRKGVKALPESLSMLFHSLVAEQLSPVRIVFGYEGYVDEMGLRKGFSDFISESLSTPRGFGVGSFPNLIVCRNNSLLKMNGQPYEAGSIARVPAPEIETLVLDGVRERLASSGAAAHPTAIADRDLIERYVDSVIVKPRALEVRLVLTDEASAQTGVPGINGPDSSQLPITTIMLAWMAPGFAAAKGIIHAPSDQSAMKPESRDVLLTAIAKARGWMEDIRLGRSASFAEIASREAQGERHIRQLALLAFVSPRIVAAIVDGTAPTGLTVTGLAKAPLYSWAEQDQSIGLPQ